MRISMDLYCQMGKELRALFADLFDLSKRESVKRQIHHIINTAEQIGGPLFKEAISLHREVCRFLEHPQDPELLEHLKNLALKIEQETREL